jgi:recombination protein RecA
VLIFINQIRQKIGVTFGSDKTTTGGNSLKFYASVRIEVTRIGALKAGEDNYGNRVKFKVVKNKVAPPFVEGEFDIIFGKGVNYEGEILDYALKHEVIDKSGAWFKYNGENIGQGRDNTCTYLVEHPEVLEEIEEQVKAALNG